ncbi:MAG: radical SAM protein [Planctomycetota bacterium]
MKNNGKRRHVFGPVYSRRLGRSLGVDLIPHKTCTYDCVYCQIGRTTDKTCSLRNPIDAEEILQDITEKLSEGIRPDVVTFSGSGEPTLYPPEKLSELATEIKKRFGVPLVMITNGSLLSDAAVREACSLCDIVMPSLDAGNEEMFRRINRPHESIEFSRMVEGLQEFRKSFKGAFRLEVMLIDGVTEEEVGQIADITKNLNPDQVEVNTPVRPSAEKGARPIEPDRLNELAGRLGTSAAAIAYKPDCENPEGGLDKDAATAILDMLKRRPCNIQDISSGLGLKPEKAEELLARLEADGRTRIILRGGLKYHVPEEN